MLAIKQVNFMLVADEYSNPWQVISVVTVGCNQHPNYIFRLLNDCWDHFASLKDLTDFVFWLNEKKNCAQVL